MIEIIICHTDTKLIENLNKNIAETCGTDFILSPVDNRAGKYDIFQAYQSKIFQSTADIIVCCHQDIIFHSNNWGKLLEKYFNENENAGAIGVAGGSAHSIVPCGWMTASPECERLINIIQHDSNGNVFSDNTISSKQGLYPAAAIDGVFMAFRSKVFEDVSFTKHALTGFHGYDIYISLQLQQHNWKVFVSSEIILEHFSMGKYSKQYVENICKIHKIHHKILPVFTSPLNLPNRRYETKSLYFFACAMVDANVSIYLYCKVILQNIRYCSLFCKSAILLGLGFFSLILKKVLTFAKFSKN